MKSEGLLALTQHPALQVVKQAVAGTTFEGRVWLVGGCVRDAVLGLPSSSDFDIVVEGDALELIRELSANPFWDHEPVQYPRFGTCLTTVQGTPIEWVTARKESYEPKSRKPHVTPATLKEDSLRRDFTANTLLLNLQSYELADPLGCGLGDLQAGILRTPTDPLTTFQDDPLRQLRAVRFRAQLGWSYFCDLEAALIKRATSLRDISAERIREEFFKMLILGERSVQALQDLMRFKLWDEFWPEVTALVGVEQGDFHFLDAWEHTLLVLKNANTHDLPLALSCLLHDIGKPGTRIVDEAGRTRFFGHENVGAAMTIKMLRRLNCPNDLQDSVAKLVKNHMRLSSSASLNPSAVRRLIRDLGDNLDRLLDLVEADASALKPGVRKLDLSDLKEKISSVTIENPKRQWVSPLSGHEIMQILNIEQGPEVGKWQKLLSEAVIEGEMTVSDKESAKDFLLKVATENPRKK